jgi:hypothetical protein
MKFEEIVIEIKKLHGILTNKEADVCITYKGKRHGVTKPWNIKIDNKEANGEDEIKVALTLLSDISTELYNKINNLKAEAASLENILKQS